MKVGGKLQWEQSEERCGLEERSSGNLGKGTEKV